METTRKRENKQIRMKEFIGSLPIFKYVKAWLDSRKEKRKIAEWNENGRPLPPPHCVKQRAVKYYAKKYDLKVLVETGTYLGEMVQAMLPHYESIYSIELDNSLYEDARIKFTDRENVEIIHGDSGVEIESLMPRIDTPTLFWLDGHYSEGFTAKGKKDTPIVEELAHICNAKESRYVILIDDARCFGVAADYPSVDELSKFVKSKKGDVSLAVEDDIIRITPKKMVG